MSVTNTDMLLKFSVAAAAGNTTAGTAAASLGDQVSTTAITTGTLNNLWDDVSSAEALAGDTEYRGIFVANDNATDTAFNVVIKLQNDAAGGASWTIASDNIGVTARGSASTQMATIANESTAPTGTSAFNTTDLTIGTMGPQTVAGFWIKRTVAASTTAVSGDNATIRIAYDG
jgi:hypothetical protein